MDSAIDFIFKISILIFSVVIHEVSHGYAALALGDRTAQYAGRLTLNPIPHIDPFGSILLPLLLYYTGAGVLFGWAKPVPYNPLYLRNQKWGPALVGAAGPGVNLLIAVFFAMIIRFAPAAAASAAAGIFAENFIGIAAGIAFLNLALALFNLVPIPPLDGSKVLFAILPWQWRSVQMFLEQYGFFVLLLFVFFFLPYLSRAAYFAFRLLTGVSLF